MRSTLMLAAALAATLLASPGAQALEPFKNYDKFTTVPLDTTRWSDLERVRVIKFGALNLMQRTLGAGNSDAGLTFMNFNDNLSNPASVTALKARVVVNALEVNACPTNPALAQSRARIIGGFFNVASPIPGSQVGDVIAQVRLTRFSNSVDAPGVLRVQGRVDNCSNTDCTTSTPIGSTVDLGTVSVGTAATVQIRWNQPTKTFLFMRDANAYTGSVVYTESDASPPSIPFKQVSTRLDLPNCLSAPRVAGVVDASFDNIAVNSSALP